MEKRGKNVGQHRSYKGRRVQGALPGTDGGKRFDMQSKILLGCWHPKENTFAVSKCNSLFIYSEKRSVNKDM